MGFHSLYQKFKINGTNTSQELPLTSRPFKVNFFAWLFAIPAAIGGFLLVKKRIDIQRKEELKAIQQQQRSKQT